MEERRCHPGRNRMDTKDQGLGEQDQQKLHQDLLGNFTLLSTRKKDRAPQQREGGHVGYMAAPGSGV